MLYLTGIYAVNVDEPEHDTACDWHCAELDWANPPLRESEGSAFGEWGISHRTLDMFGHVFDGYIASHARACLDMLEDGRVGQAQGMREYYIGNDAKYTDVILGKALLLRDSPHWAEIDRLLGREYGVRWLDEREVASLGRRETPGADVRPEQPRLSDVPDADLNRLCERKCLAYLSNRKIYDLYDIVCLCTERYDELDPHTRDLLFRTLEHEDLNQLDYIVRSQPAPAINADGLEAKFMKSFKILGLAEPAHQPLLKMSEMIVPKISES